MNCYRFTFVFIIGSCKEMVRMLFLKAIACEEVGMSTLPIKETKFIGSLILFLYFTCVFKTNYNKIKAKEFDGMPNSN